MENTQATSTATPNTAAANAPKYNPQEYMDLADNTFKSFIKEGKYKDIISSMATLGDYSLRNQMFILQQCPTATKVNSMNGWNFNKRNIQKGSQSIKILAPVFDSVVTTENSQVVTKQNDYVSGYKINFVFDISQIASKTPEEMRADSENLEQYYEVIDTALKSTLKSYEFKEADIASDGILDTRQKTITLKNGMSKEQTLKTLVDQISAALVLGRSREKFQGLRPDALPEITAIEISGVSEIVSKRLGLESQGLQQPDFSKMSDENLDKFSSNLNLIRSVSQRIIIAIDTAMSETLAKERAAEKQAMSDEMFEAVFGEEPSAPPAVEAEVQEKSKKTIKSTTKTKVKAEAEMA